MPHRLPASAPGSRRTRRLLATLAISGLNYAALPSCRLIVPMIALGMGTGTLLVGAISASFTVLPVFMSARFGRWVDRGGALIPAACASVITMAACALFLPLPSRYVLVAIAGLVGAGTILNFVAATRAVTTGCEGEQERSTRLGYLMAIHSGFQFIGPVAAGFALERYGATTAFLGVGAFSLLALIGLATGFHEFGIEKHQAPNRQQASGSMTLLGQRELRRWLVTNSVFSAGLTLYPFVMSLRAVEIGMSAATAGLLVGAFSAGTLISRTCLGIIFRLFPSRKAVLFASLVSGGIAYAVLPSLHDAVVLVALSVFLGASLGVGVPVSLGLIYDTAPQGRVNEAVGVAMAMANAVQTIAPLTLGVVASGLGVQEMGWSLGVAMLAVACLGAVGARGGRDGMKPHGKD